MPRKDRQLYRLNNRLDVVIWCLYLLAFIVLIICGLIFYARNFGSEQQIAPSLTVSVRQIVPDARRDPYLPVSHSELSVNRSARPGLAETTCEVQVTVWTANDGLPPGMSNRPPWWTGRKAGGVVPSATNSILMLAAGATLTLALIAGYRLATRAKKTPAAPGNTVYSPPASLMPPLF
jgi:hypothetical protein